MRLNSCAITDVSRASTARCVKVTRAGLESLRESRKVLDSMWKGLDSKLRSVR